MAKEEAGPVEKKAKSESKASGAAKPIKTVVGAASSNIRQTDMKTMVTGVAKAVKSRDDQNNPTCRDAFKSLFTSSQPDQAKDKTSNWITCNSYK